MNRTSAAFVAMGLVALAPSWAFAQGKRPGKKDEPKETAKDFAIPEQGLSFKVPDEFELRTRTLKFNWPGARCELQSADGEVCGLLFFASGGGPAALQADAKEEFWKSNRGIRDVERVKNDVLRREGDWLARELTLVHGSEKRHYRHVFGVRGSRAVDLTIWTKAAAWEARRKDVEALEAGLVFKRIWACPGCGQDTGPDARECASCKASLVAPDPELEAWARKAGIRIVGDPGKVYPFKSGGERVVAKAAPPEAVREYCVWLAKELRRYPDEVFQRLGVERIVLCKDLFGGSMRRGALVDYETDSVHCDVVEGKQQEGFQVTAVHHELFHLMDARDDGTTKKDPTWEALNAAGFKYGPRNKDATFDGFASIYAMSSIGEDKAELYGNLMFRPKWVRERVAKDAVLARKLTQLKAQLKAWCPPIDEKFWSAGE